MELAYRVDAIVWMLRGGPEQMVRRGCDSMVAIVLCYCREHCIYGFYSVGTIVYRLFLLPCGLVGLIKQEFIGLNEVIISSSFVSSTLEI